MVSPNHIKEKKPLVTSAEGSDARSIAELHGELFDQSWDAIFIADLITDDTCKVFVARMPGQQQCCGFVILRCAADQAEVLSIGVAKSYQGLGIGGQLVDAALKAVMQGDVKTLFLEVASDNEPARRLYERCGFQQIDIRKTYYRRALGQSCDALVLSLAAPWS